MATIRPGGEINTLCTKCAMVLAHTIIAVNGGKPVKVQCNTCRNQHSYHRNATAKPGEKAPPKPRETPETRAAKSFEVEMAKSTAIPQPYSVKHTYVMDDAITHPTFGRGLVCAVRQDKVDVLFRAGVKTLIHARR